MSTLNILLVEDVADYAKMTLDTLAQIGISGNWVETGAQALEYIDEHTPDAILLDIGLPDMTGWDFMKVFRERVGEHHCPIIVLTGRSDSPNRIMGKLQYVSGYIVKPYKPLHLIETLMETLELYKIGV